MLGIAAAPAAERRTAEQAHLVLLVKQTPDDFFERQVAVEQFIGCDRGAEDRDMLPSGMVEPGVQPVTPLLALGEVLEQQPARLAPVGITTDRNPDEAGNLLGLRKIALRGFSE